MNHSMHTSILLKLRITSFFGELMLHVKYHLKNMR